MRSCRPFEKRLLILCLLCTYFTSATLALRPTLKRQNNIVRPPDLSRRFHKFVTRPDIDAPVWDIRLYRDGRTGLAPGYLFVSFYGELHQKAPGKSWIGPHIYDQSGDLIWSGASAFKHWNVFDFAFDHDNSDDVLTLLSNHDKKGYILDNTYQIRKELPLLIDGETESNMHSFNVMDNGKRALILSARSSLASKEESNSLGFAGSCLINYEGFRELDLESSDFKPLFEWKVNGHIALDESKWTTSDGNVTKMCTEGWDIFHLNSIDKFPDGDYLVSARHTNALYKVSHTDGSIVWRLGGTKSDFKFEDNSAFSRQHHGRVRSQNETHTLITLFDNAVGDGRDEVPTHEYSRGVILSLDTRSMMAKAISEYSHPEKGLTAARGSFQTLPNGNSFICWAYNSLITESAPYGKVMMQAKLGADVHTYRAFKYPWVGRPAHPPDVVSQALFNGSQTMTSVYMSWNGATDIVGWQVYEVDNAGQSRLLGSEKRAGFETSTIYDGYVKKIFAEALDVEGKSLGKSRVVRTMPPTEIGVESSIWHTGDVEESAHSVPNEILDSDGQMHSGSSPSPENANEVEATHPENSTENATTSSELISLSVVIVFAGVATIVGLILGLLVPRISTSWSALLRRRNNIRYENLQMDDEADDMEEAEQLEKG